MRNSQKIEILHQKIHDVEAQLNVALKNGKKNSDTLEQILNKLAEVSGHKIVKEKIVKETICGDKIVEIVKLEKIVKK